MDKNIELEKENRCISCAYLSIWNQPFWEELYNVDRRHIVNRSWNSVLLFRLRCLKNLHTDKFENFPKDKTDDAMEWVSNAVCSGKEWRLHQDGISPQDAFQQEQHEKSQRLTGAAIGISIITFVALVIFSVALLKGCQW